MTTKESSSYWDCATCTFINNPNMSYCEKCLQSNNASQSMPPSALEYNPYLDHDLVHESAKYSSAKNQAYMRQHDNDEKAEHDDWQCSSCTAINNKYLTYCEQCLISKSSENIKNEWNSPICKCGTKMQAITAAVYEGISHYKYVVCDICNNKIPKEDVVFHCPKKQVADYHPDGFDICLLCRRKYIHRLRYFAALIICPSIHSKDAKVLQFMFHKLGFHQIICLTGKQVSKDSVEKKLNELLPHNSMLNINQFTVICYSGCGRWEDDNYYFALDEHNSNNWISADYIKKRCSSTASNETNTDTTWNKTYYRHNTLLLINSCNTNNQINDSLESQRISAAFTPSNIKLCESMIVIVSAHKEHLYSYGLSVSSFIEACCNFFDLLMDLLRNQTMHTKMDVSPIMLFKYLQQCYQQNRNISLHDIAENICSLMKMRLPKKELILQRKMSNAFGVIGHTTGVSHEYHVISDPNTGRMLRTEMLNQDFKYIAKHPLKNIRIRSQFLESNDVDVDVDDGKCYETYYLDPIKFPDLESVKHVIDEIAKGFDKRTYNLGRRNCQIYGAILTAQLYGIQSECVRIKDKYWMNKVSKVEDKITELIKKLDFIHMDTKS